MENLEKRIINKDTLKEFDTLINKRYNNVTSIEKRKEIEYHFTKLINELKKL